MPFDLTISFDTAEYLNPQLYMLANTLKGNIPEDTILHITTNRPDYDPVLQYIKKCVPTKIYYKQPFNNLKSRCQYMFHCFEIETDKPWVVKIEIDILILKHLSEIESLLDDRCDIIIQSENRRIINEDMIEFRLWRNIYKSMNISCPNWKMQFVEGDESGMPLLATGVVAVKSSLLETINRRWVSLTEICERWIDYNIHPNEFAFTALILDEKWKFKLLPVRFNYNPIGHFRKGKFPSQELIEDCKLPDNCVILDYHRPQWLLHIAKYNKNVMDIIENNKQYIPESWWKLSSTTFIENKNEP